MKIGPYSILRQIAKGGMGEVLLVFDPSCERSLALKRIRDDLKGKRSIKARFLREVKLTAQLTHPGIISIYQIHEEHGELYYTMPYVEGKTLKQLLRSKENNIESLISIFKSICQTVAYAHTKGILHRDLKPENILVGNFGEVIILDWGLSQLIGEPENHLEKDEDKNDESQPDLTLPGKIVGTLAFMSPERALGGVATRQSEIYALGVTLYLILTLRLPFERSSLKEFRENWHLETLPDPEEVAPYRDVPPRLSRIVKKCLSTSPNERYESVENLLLDLSAYIEGRAEWFEIATLSLKNKKDWEFQENLLLSKHLAIAQEGEWVALSVSKSSFGEPLRLASKLYLGPKCFGLGFLLNIPEGSSRMSPFEGYCLWLAAQGHGQSALFRNGIEVMKIPDLTFEPDKTYDLVLEKNEKSIRLTVNGSSRFTYLSYLPLFGTHIGILARDADFELSQISLFAGSAELQVSCLAVPDAFLAHRDFKRALAEFRRIATSFPGQLEGREALFRSGITLLEEAKTTKQKRRAHESFALALEEFSKLHTTPGAPLEYLGKSLVYLALNDRVEEAKCLELALRRYQKHPLIAAIKEQILYRMHESASRDRFSAYQLILVALRHIPEVLDNSEAHHLFQHLLNYAERPFFLEKPVEPSLLNKDKRARVAFEIELGYWSALPFALLELFDLQMAEDDPDSAILGNILYALFDLGAHLIGEKLLERMQERLKIHPRSDLEEIVRYLKPIAVAHKTGNFKKTLKTFFDEKPPKVPLHLLRTAIFLMQKAIFIDEEKLVEAIASPLLQMSWSHAEKKLIDCWRIWAFLKSKNLNSAHILFETYSEEELLDERSLLFPLYGCYLYLTEDDTIFEVFFSGVTDVPFPPTPALLAHELVHHISKNEGWFNTAFLYEKRMLYRELLLLAECQNREDLIRKYQLLEKEQNLQPSI